MGGGRAGTGVAAMEGGVLVPAHMKGLSTENRNTPVLFLILEWILFYFFFFFLSDLWLRSFDANVS